MTRNEYIQWCKDRANARLEKGEMKDAWASMISDLTKHPETKNHAGIELGIMLMRDGLLNTHQEIKKYIDGFN